MPDDKSVSARFDPVNMDIERAIWIRFKAFFSELMCIDDKRLVLYYPI